MWLLEVFLGFCEGGQRPLTYKSFRDECEGHIARRRLFRFEPRQSQAPGTRGVLLSAEVAGLVLGPWPDTPLGFRCARLRAEFDAFVGGKFPDCLLDAVQRQGAPQSWTAEPRRTRRMGFALRRPAAGLARVLLPRRAGPHRRPDLQSAVGRHFLVAATPVGSAGRPGMETRGPRMPIHVE